MYVWSDAPAKAIGPFTELIKLQPTDPAHRIARARAYRSMGQLPEARADFAQAKLLGADPAAITDALAAMEPRALNPDAVAPSQYRWAAGLSTGWTDHGDFARWNEQTASLRHYGKLGSIGFEALRVHRFDESDYAWALDGYTDLWSGAYANIRYQRAPMARLFPGNSGRVEVYQSLGNGWEGALSDDVLVFPSTRVNIYGISLAKYIGNYYISLRHQEVRSDGSSSNGDRLLARYYYRGDADHYVEMRASRGRSDDAQSLLGGQTRSGSFGMAWLTYFKPNWSFKASASTSHGGADDKERSLSVGVSHRW
jgi:YaiO family outer membrane protein